jgi:hypothetical protein
MSGFKQHLDLSLWEDPVRYAARCRGALNVSISGGDIPVVVSGVLGDIGVTPTTDLLRRGQGCELVVGGGLRGRG